tara:strand:+ start:31 stop:447 length:417 start_codon:yes stop_codon:yes gene_type:complete
MNDYLYENISVGLVEKFEKKITEEMLSGFKAITGDDNPLHNDLEFAKKRGFHDKVVYGMLTTSLLSTLAGVYLPGKYSLIHSTRIFFHKPVFVGDTITVSGKVKEKDERYNIIKLKIIMENQDDKKVLSGSMQVGVTA